MLCLFCFLPLHFASHNKNQFWCPHIHIQSKCLSLSLAFSFIVALYVCVSVCVRVDKNTKKTKRLFDFVSFFSLFLRLKNNEKRHTIQTQCKPTPPPPAPSPLPHPSTFYSYSNGSLFNRHTNIDTKTTTRKRQTCPCVFPSLIQQQKLKLYNNVHDIIAAVGVRFGIRVCVCVGVCFSPRIPKRPFLSFHFVFSRQLFWFFWISPEVVAETNPRFCIFGCIFWKKKKARVSVY